MQPQDPITGPAAQPPAAREPGLSSGAPLGGGGQHHRRFRREPNRRARLVLAMVFGVVALLCLGGVGVAVSLYDEAAKIDRSQPDVVTDSFLIAYLVNRDDKAARLFTCDSPNLAHISALRDEITAREKEFDVKVSVSWGALAREAAGQGQEDVTTQLTISGSSNGQITSSRNEDWRFRVIDQGESWRLCDGAKVS